VIQEPTKLTPAPGEVRGTRRSSAIKIALIVCAVVLLAIPVAMAMHAATPPLTPEKVLAAGASASPDATPKPDGDKSHARLRAALGRKGEQRAPIRGPITIRARDGSQISLATDDGWTRTITATTDTAITKGGAPIAVGDLKVGDEVRIRETRNDDGTYSITAIVVLTPRSAGEVTKVDGDAITIKQRDGTTRVITITGSTVYRLGRASGAKSDMTVGTDIVAQGTVSGDTFTAITIDIKLAHAGGEVTAKTADSITVTDRAGKTIVIHVTASTTYKVRGHHPAALSDIALSDRLAAAGTRRADGSLDATSVIAGPQHRQKTPSAPASVAP
jgi:hypothetical protein